MALIPGGKPFVADEVETKQFENIADGDYIVIITDSEVVQTKAKDGSYLKLTFKVIEDTFGNVNFANQKVWHNLNLENKSEQAVAIAQSDLKAICIACDLPGVTDSQELHGIPMVAHISIRKGRDGYKDQNAISKWRVTEPF
jgi:hypothetical protein